MLGKHSWYRVVDTASGFEEDSNAWDRDSEQRMDGARYTVYARSLLVLAERPTLSQ